MVTWLTNKKRYNDKKATYVEGSISYFHQKHNILSFDSSKNFKGL